MLPGVSDVYASAIDVVKPNSGTARVDISALVPIGLPIRSPRSAVGSPSLGAGPSISAVLLLAEQLAPTPTSSHRPGGNVRH
jgi:hypothetical protein